MKIINHIAHMGEHHHLALYTKKQEDLVKVTEYAIQQSREQHLRTYNAEACDEWIFVDEDCILWLSIDTVFDFDELFSNIAMHFPDVEFVVIDFPADDPSWTEFIWDGKEWQKTGWYTEYEEIQTENEKSFLYSLPPRTQKSAGLELPPPPPHDPEDDDLPF